MDNIGEIINNLNFSSILWQIFGSLIFILADVISGVISAFIQKNLDSQKMREGLLRKILLVIVIALSFVAQQTFNITIISKVVCIYIILMEIISILENLKKAGIELGKIGDLLKVKNNDDNITLVFQKGENNEKRD